jgi:hypothetical protein
MGCGRRAEQLRTNLAMNKPILFLASVLFAIATVGCTHVAPYERGILAHPSMAAEGFDGPAAEHVHAVHEGATGGGSLSEAGCGCN